MRRIGREPQAWLLIMPMLAIMVGVLDVTYIALLLSRLRRLTAVDEERVPTGLETARV